jgi:hypothetical protein
MTINIDSENLVLRDNPNVCHDDGKVMYSCYGAHISTDAHGDICVQAVHWEWMDDGKDADTFRRERGAECGEAITPAELAAHADYAVCMTRWESFRRRGGPLDWDTCESLVELARSLRAEIEPIAQSLSRAAEAALAGDIDACLEALRDARGLETDHGDDPSTSALAAQLLEPREEAE